MSSANFPNDLIVKLIHDDESGLWELQTEFSYQAKSGKVFTAPKGFQTDFCSVPRVPLAYDLLGNRARKAGVVHDWLYTCHVTSRLEADQLLYEMLQNDGVDSAEASAFYLAVRAGGGSHWGHDPK